MTTEKVTVKSLRKALALRQQQADALSSEADAERAVLELKTAKLKRKILKSQDYHYGVFRLYDVIDGATCVSLEMSMAEWARANPGKSITLYLHSPGGELMAGWLLYDALRTLSKQGHHVTVVVRGYAASMGAVLLQAGDTRLVGEESHLMVHEVSYGVQGKMSDHEDTTKTIAAMNKRLFKVLAQRSTLSAKQLLAKVQRRDVWMDSNEAVSLGLADAIG